MSPTRPDARRVLVATSVHQAEDPRIRWRTVAPLAAAMPVRYAAKEPAPSTDGAPSVDGDYEWVPLRGGRVVRALRAAREAWRRDVAIVSLHDPELLPIGLLVRVARRIPVVFDVHEDVPAQILTKTAVPGRLRGLMSKVTASLLRTAERVLTITLAEPNYRHLFRNDHPVLPNYPDLSRLPHPQSGDGSVVYVGDVTELRGASLAVEAVAALDPPPTLRLIGRCAPPLADKLRTLAAERGVDLDLPGFVPHPDAMRIVARASVGLSPLADVPNYRRSLPTKTLEYLALGVPVLASDLEGTSSVIGEMDAVTLVRPGVVGEWRDAIALVLADPGMRQKAAAQAPTIRERFRFRPEEVQRVYANALDQAGR